MVPADAEHGLEDGPTCRQFVGPQIRGCGSRWSCPAAQEKGKKMKQQRRLIWKLRRRMNENMDDPTPAVMELSRKTEEIWHVRVS